MYDYKNLKVYKKSQINGLTKHLGSFRFGTTDTTRDLVINRAIELGLEVDYNNSNISGEKFLFKLVRKIMKEQSQFGKAWLKHYFFKLDGSPRQGKRIALASEQTLKIAKNVARFEFIGVLGAYTTDYRDFNHFVPIYRAYDKKGNYFDYAPVFWGQPIIMES